MKDVIAVSCLGYCSNTTPGMAHLREVTRKYRPDARKMTRSYTQGWIILTPDTLVEAYKKR